VLEARAKASSAKRLKQFLPDGRFRIGWLAFAAPAFEWIHLVPPLVIPQYLLTGRARVGSPKPAHVVVERRALWRASGQGAVLAGGTGLVLILWSRLHLR
jgi:hypothetical protein